MTAADDPDLTPRIVLFGGTDLTLAIAEHLRDRIVGVIAIEREFSISYSPAGMRNSRFADLKAWADGAGVPYLAWSGADSAIEAVRLWRPDLGVAAGWYFMLPGRLRKHIPHGVAGLHASMLPRYRGNAPLNWAIINGESETGVSLFQLDDGVDEGALFGQASFAVTETSAIADLIDLSTAASIRLLSDLVEHWPVEPTAQVGAPSYCLVRRPADSRIDWRHTVSQVDRLVRASGRPYEGAFSFLDSRRLTVWRARPSPLELSGSPGQVWRAPDGSVLVVCGIGALEVLECELEGERDATSSLTVVASRSMQFLDAAIDEE